MDKNKCGFEEECRKYLNLWVGYYKQGVEHIKQKYERRLVMEKRIEINNKIVDWIINKVKTEYADDISLVLIYGSYINGTANSKSDVDCYYIPKTERGYHLAVDFIIDGVGYDIFPISWERVAGIADLQESLSPLVGEVQIIYCNSPSDLEHFKALQERLKRNLLDEEYVRDIAVSRCEQANKMCALMNISQKLSDVRKLAGMVIMTLADAVAVYNHDYFHFGLKKQYDDLQNGFPNVPKDITNEYKNVIEAGNMKEVINHTLKMYEAVCDYLNITLVSRKVASEEAVEVSAIDGSCLAELYEEISSTFNKIYTCCENGNYILAFLSAVCLQRDLDDEARKAGCPAYDLLGTYKYTELGLFSAITRKIECDFVQFITENGGCIRKYDSFEQFKSAKL